MSDPAETEVKELLYCFVGPSLQILVPKRRGIGYLKQPIGHHPNALSRLETEAGYDLFGLDGAIEVHCGFLGSQERMDKVAKQVLEPISRLLGFPYREVGGEEFWSKHPIPRNDDSDMVFYR